MFQITYTRQKVAGIGKTVFCCFFYLLIGIIYWKDRKNPHPYEHNKNESPRVNVNWSWRLLIVQQAHNSHRKFFAWCELLRGGRNDFNLFGKPSHFPGEAINFPFIVCDQPKAVKKRTHEWSIAGKQNRHQTWFGRCARISCRCTCCNCIAATCGQPIKKQPANPGEYLCASLRYDAGLQYKADERRSAL